MRPFRFHIGTLLILVLILGVGFAALRESNEIWDSSIFSLTLGMLSVSILLAIHRTERGFGNLDELGEPSAHVDVGKVVGLLELRHPFPIIALCHEPTSQSVRLGPRLRNREPCTRPT